MSEAIFTSDDLFRDINSMFLSTYRDTVGQNPKLQQVMQIGVPSSKRTERFGYFESPPTLDRIDRGEAVGFDAFKAIAYSVTNLTWGKGIGWHEEDLEDIQLGDFRQVVQRLALRAAALPEEVFFQIITGAASARLLEAIPTAPDGAALYATTAGGANRFGVSYGNLLSGGGVTTAQLVRADFWNAIEQWKQFQDTEGEPLLDDGILDQGITVVYGAALSEIFAEAFSQGRTVAYRAGTSTTDTSTSVQVTNSVMDSGQKVTLWGTQRISDNDWFCFADAISPKAVFQTSRRPPRVIEENRENSEAARRNRILGQILDMRAGFGVNAAYGTIKINN